MTISLLSVVEAAYAALKAEIDRINALNVYPVPDGDTGTNMLLTLESILNEARDSSYETTPEKAGKAGARAALMGARGNSGVILSQMIRGASEVLADSASFDAETFTAALEGSAKRAYSSVREPVEGTMLTVMKDAARAARRALEDDKADLAVVVGAATKEAHASVRRTPELLKTLRDAGVVDAGGLGVAVILDGLYACVTGREIEREEMTAEEEATPNLDSMTHADEEAWGYCTEFFVTGFSGEPEEFGEHIHEIGKSVLVVPDDDVIKVHLHTQDPGDALSYAGGFGRLSGVKIEDMEAQVRERPRQEAEKPAARLGVVAASRGEGNRELFERMGAVVIEGGQGANPSAADFAEAVEKANAEAVVLLPNNKNIVPTAEQVGELVECKVVVVPTLSIASGLATMVGFDPEDESEDVIEEMRDIAKSLRHAEITRAVREARVSERDIPEGAFIGLLDGELCAVGGSVAGVAVEVAEKMLGAGADVITLVYGEDLDREQAEEVSHKIEALDEDVEVELRDGGQPMYPLQMVAE